MGNSTQPDNLLKSDRIIIITGLVLITILSWWYIIYLYRQMAVMDMSALFFAMPTTQHWTITDFVLLFIMWLVMMIAMMTPSVISLILVFAMVNRQRRHQQNPFVHSGYLLAGYFLVWGCFSILATLLQWALQQLALLNPEMKTTSKILGSIILIVAGIFQFTALKRTCLGNCRTPIDFIHRKWKEGRRGALMMGIESGTYCLGCCWVLMALLFFSGIMNLLWIALIAAFVLIEKTFPRPKWISSVAGAVLIIYGLIVLLY